jgi:hypothetical protein
MSFDLYANTNPNINEYIRLFNQKLIISIERVQETLQIG